MWLQVLVLFLCIYFWFLYQFSYWKKRGFPFVPGKFPMGSISGLGTTEHASDFFKREYEKYKNDGPAFGIYMMAKPTLIPTDPELIRDIFTRNFETFHERGLNVSEAADPLSQHLFFKSGQEWKELRAKLTPTFTSGKMKMMFPNVITKADRMIEYLKPFAEKAEPLEMKEIYSSFTTEVISDVAFGLETDCLGNPDSEFRRMANVAVQPSGWEFLKIFFVVSFSKLASFLRLGFNGKAVTEFFTRIVRETVSYRETNNVQRNDFMQLLMNIQKTEGLTFTDLAANSFVFFLAG